MIRRMRRLVLPFVIALALAAPATAGAVERAVSVTATVERQVPNDAAEVHFAVSKERPGRAAALRIVAARVQAVIVASQGIAGVDAGTSPPARSRCGGSSGASTPSTGRARGSPWSPTVRRLPATWLRRELLPALRARGGPRFFVGDREAAYNAALVEALEKAKTKAGLLAAAAGARLGPAITIVESGGVTAFEGTRGAASPKSEDVPAPPVKPGKSTVEATVAVTFALE
jgi:uncharacterized protein YggE